MSISIKMPALSPTMTDGTLARWLVSEGDEVRSGDVIAEIETDKATMEVEAIDEGIVAVIAVEAGAQNVPVNAVIAILAEEGEDPASITADAPHDVAPEVAPEAAAAPSAQVPPAQAPSAPTIDSAIKSQVAQTASATRVFASPLARRIAAQNDLPLDGITGTGPNGRIIKFDIETALSQGVATPSQASGASHPVTSVEDRFVPQSRQLRISI